MAIKSISIIDYATFTHERSKGVLKIFFDFYQIFSKYGLFRTFLTKISKNMYTLLHEKGVSMDNHIRGLFPITQAAEVCGLSRSTLMRMEERELLAILENRLNLLQRNVEELRIRAMTTPDISVQMMTLPEIVCCTRRYTGLTVQERYDAMYALFHECIENGYVLSGFLPAGRSPSYFTAITAAWTKRGLHLAGKRRSAGLPLPRCPVESVSWLLIPDGRLIRGNTVQGL